MVRSVRSLCITTVQSWQPEEILGCRMNTYIAMPLPRCHWHDHNKAADVSWNPAGHRVLHGKAPPDATWHKQEGETREGASTVLFHSAAMVQVLGSCSLTERLLYAHSSSCTSFANKEAQDTTVLAAWQGASRAQDQSYWFILHCNQQGRIKYILYSSAFPLFIPRPQKCSIRHSSYTRTGDLLCHRQPGHVSTGGGGRLSTHFPFLSMTWALHWEETALVDRAPLRKDCVPGPHTWHHRNLLCTSCSTWQQSQAWQTKVAECHGILWKAKKVKFCWKVSTYGFDFSWCWVQQSYLY